MKQVPQVQTLWPLPLSLSLFGHSLYGPNMSLGAGSSEMKIRWDPQSPKGAKGQEVEWQGLPFTRLALGSTVRA